MNSSFGISDKGSVRKGNEDAFISVTDLGLFVVADGMGGHNAGEVASRLAVEAIVGFVEQSVERGKVSWPYGIDRELSLDGNRLRTAIYLANCRVFRAAEEHDNYAGMGTTVVSALLADSKLIVAHVGDSRLYIFADGTLRQVTKDDSWAATVLTQAPTDDKTAGAAHPMRNVLTNVLGVREEVEIHLAELPIQGSETLLLCTDGLHGTLTDEAIARIMVNHNSIEIAAQALVAASLEAGSRDNVTALLVKCGSV